MGNFFSYVSEQEHKLEEVEKVEEVLEEVEEIVKDVAERVIVDVVEEVVVEEIENKIHPKLTSIPEYPSTTHYTNLHKNKSSLPVEHKELQEYEKSNLTKYSNLKDSSKERRFSFYI